MFENSLNEEIDNKTQDDIYAIFQLYITGMKYLLFPVRTKNYLEGLIKHQFYCHKFPVLLDFCRQEHWLNYDYNNLTKIGYASDQWKLLSEKKK